MTEQQNRQAIRRGHQSSAGTEQRYLKELQDARLTWTTTEKTEESLKRLLNACAAMLGCYASVTNEDTKHLAMVTLAEALHAEQDLNLDAGRYEKMELLRLICEDDNRITYFQSDEHKFQLARLYLHLADSGYLYHLGDSPCDELLERWTGKSIGLKPTFRAVAETFFGPHLLALWGDDTVTLKEIDDMLKARPKFYFEDLHMQHSNSILPDTFHPENS